MHRTIAGATQCFARANAAVCNIPLGGGCRLNVSDPTENHVDESDRYWACAR